jgi:ribosomal protein L29
LFTFTLTMQVKSINCTDFSKKKKTKLFALVFQKKTVHLVNSTTVKREFTAH